MKTLRALALTGAIAGTALPCAATDLEKIERRILKEPSYESKPQYGLLVFGPRAKTRVWVALDEHALYVDRNSDLELSAESERVALDQKEFRPVEILEPQGEIRHRILSVKPWRTRDGEQALSVTVKVNDQYRQFANCYLADTPQKAPILHFDGPLTIRLDEQPTLVAGQPEELYVGVGTPGLGRDAFAYLSVEVDSVLPEETHPAVQLVFPPKTPGTQPKTLHLRLPHRC
ncbi:MAG: hypothetical protein KY476_20760 [Planctomycetes bacterium]|nr:hypothetical protein [Planctomycetota bacterium]